METLQALVITPEDLLSAWQGNRRLTRRVIEAFPEEALFSYSLGGMRPFSDMVFELVGLSHGIGGIATGQWPTSVELFAPGDPAKPATKAALLALWDQTTDLINETWPTIPAERFQESDLSFGMWRGKIWWLLFYWSDNEVHHRGQGYVYLRTLGIEPPAFWDRA